MKIEFAFEFRIVLLLLTLLAACVGGFFIFCCLAGSNVRGVILISIDTCRADHLSCYGYPHMTTENIDRVAQEGILFTNAYTPVPITLPAHASMLTGSIPPYHGTHDNSDYKLDQTNVTLAEILGRNGFTTGAVIGAFVLDSKFGLNQGFDDYNDHFVGEPTAIDVRERKAKDVTRLGLEWLEKNKNEKFFLFLHYYDPHQFYEPPEPFASMFHDNPYAGEIAYTDRCIGKVIKKLKDLELYESSLIIITGDHGEMRGEHGEKNHSYFIYQSAIKVPLIFKLPGIHKGKNIDAPVGLIDIVPTICAVLDIKAPNQVQGQNLSEYFGQKRLPGFERQLYCESFFPTKYGANSLLGVINNRWKYIQTTRPELYNLIEDPGESKNLIKEQPQRARVLQDHLRQILTKSVRKDNSGSRLRLDEESREQLESLGYLASTSIVEDFQFDQNKEDPKDLIVLHKRHTQAEGLINLGNKLAARGIFNKAAQCFSEALRINPDFEKAQNNLGNVFFYQGRLDKAFSHYSNAVRLRPDYAEALNGLGCVLAAQGRFGEAIEHFSRAIKIDPDYVKALNNLAWIFATQKTQNFRDGPKAVQLTEHACEITDYKDFHLLNTLAAAYAEAGRFNDARQTSQKAIALARSAGRVKWVEVLEERLRLYSANKVYRE